MTRAAHRVWSHVAAPMAGLARGEHGAAAIYVAIALPAFVGAGGLAVDVASWYSSKRTIQSGADAAAYAAALELARQGLDQAPNLTTMQAVANDAAGRNGVGVAVTLNFPPLSGPWAGDPQSVEAIVTEPAPVYFTSLFMGAPPPITSRAVAKAVVSDACIWSLHPSTEGAFRASGTADVDLDCGIVVNSSHEQAALLQEGSSCVSATSVSVHGGYTGSCVTPEPEVFTPNYGDPLSYLTPPSYGACDYPNSVIVDAAMAAAYGGGPVPLNPGVYCGGIEIQANQTAIFAPGLYVLKTGQFYIAGNAHVSNTENASGGVTFYLTGSGTDYATLVFESGADITLTPMTTGALANVLFYQDPNAPASTACSKSKTSPKCSRFAGGVTMDLNGILYFPNQHVEMTGGSSTDELEILLVASTVAFTGNSYLNADYAGSVLPDQHYVRLVE
ncbi:MAG TPA: pilus assembly protein TadG-related protein [Geminicoccaceae bacterium]